MGPYAYKELKDTEIRLATLHPGRKQDDIRLSIEIATLIALGPRRQSTLPGIEKIHQQRPANPVSYEALSYTWGSLAATEVAYIIPDKENSTDDTFDSSTLPLGQNLAQALRGLRYEDRERTLWVDAICINQENSREVDVQVARAGTVYEEARRVVVWLGQESHDSGLAIRTLDYLAAQVEMNTKHSLYPAPGATETDWHLPETPLPYDIPTWTAIDSLLRRPWFTRVWVQQELHLADEAIFLCGAKKLSRESLRRATFTLYTKQKLGPVVSRAVVTDTMRTMLPFLSTCTIFHTFSRIWNGQCKNKKDLVYGALGLFPPSFRRKIKVDYSLPIDKVYMNFVKEHIKHVNRLEILRHCQSAESRPGMPSWVPDFSSRSAPKVTLGAWHFCSGHSACHFDFRGPVLEVVGVQVAVIESVGEVIPMRVGGRDGNFDAAARVIRRLVAEFQAEHAGIEMGSKPENFVWNLLGGTWLHDRLPENLIGNLEQVRFVMSASKVFGSGKLEDGLVELSFPEEFCMNLLMGARVTKTTEGHIGIAPANAQKGDIIACFLGLDSPIALRPADNEYVVVGECYMPAFADLYAFLGPLPAPWQVRFFTENSDGAGGYRYFNPESKEETDHDPRLDPLLEDLEVVPRHEVERTGDDPTTFQVYRSRETGKIVGKADPMLTPALLDARGCRLRRFALI